mmetsp:Transcript_3044/g.5131  ORF Transcript_3044/g.5131 Transcript_3044/m.5131 type:complete len:138 (-) Transcript_3044:299-712(-)
MFLIEGEKNNQTIDDYYGSKELTEGGAGSHLQQSKQPSVTFQVRNFKPGSLQERVVIEVLKYSGAEFSIPKATTTESSGEFLKISRDGKEYDLLYICAICKYLGSEFGLLPSSKGGSEMIQFCDSLVEELNDLRKLK